MLPKVKCTSLVVKEMFSGIRINILKLIAIFDLYNHKFVLIFVSEKIVAGSTKLRFSL